MTGDFDHVCDGRPLYLACQPDPVFAFVHALSTTPAGAVGAVLCPPFGYADICSYGARRTWAQALARAGHPTIRIDLPGTGDSMGSPRDPGRFDAWTRAISEAATWLRAEFDLARVVAIGIGLGGMLAYRAVASGAGIDDLLLWAVPARGRMHIRELRAFATLELELSGEPPADASQLLPEEGIEFAGYLLSAETVAAITALDLTELRLPHAAQRRVLLLGRDGMDPDRRLREHLDEEGASVAVEAGEGYGAMMLDAQFARAPESVIASSIAWLADAPTESVGGTGTAPAAPVSAGPELKHDWGGVTVRETPMTVECSAGHLFGILTEPVGCPATGLCALFLNPGSERRIGSTRMWVETARRWASRGVPSMRLDFASIGDSDGDDRRYLGGVTGYYEADFTEQITAALDALEARGIANRFTMAGLCSGAFWSFQGAFLDERVSSAVVINAGAFFWDPWAVIEYDKRLTAPIVYKRDWGAVARNALRPDGARWAMRRLLIAARTRRRVAARKRETEDAFDLLRDRGTDLLLLFSRTEALHERLIADGQIDQLDHWPNVRVIQLPTTDHTVRANHVQRVVAAALDEELDRALAKRAPPPRVAS